MKKTLSQKLWNLSMAMQSLQQMDCEEVIWIYEIAFTLHNKAQIDAERTWAEHLLNDAKKEIDRRKINIDALYVSMDFDGNFLKGRELLKRLFLSVDFDTMDEIAERMREKCVTEAQRVALIDLEREVVMET